MMMPKKPTASSSITSAAKSNAHIKQIEKAPLFLSVLILNRWAEVCSNARLMSDNVVKVVGGWGVG